MDRRFVHAYLLILVLHRDVALSASLAQNVPWIRPASTKSVLIRAPEHVELMLVATSITTALFARANQDTLVIRSQDATRYHVSSQAFITATIP